MQEKEGESKWRDRAAENERKREHTQGGGERCGGRSARPHVTSGRGVMTHTEEHGVGRDRFYLNNSQSRSEG
jgi:hypothetical protein